MTSLRRPLLRLLNALRPGRGEEELQREIAAHLALLEDEYRARGLGDEEARFAARRAFGGVEQAKEQQREARSFSWLDDARRDASYAVRTLRRVPGFSVAVVLTLALGIGANTAMFTVLDGVVLKPLRYPAAERIVTVQTRWTDTGRTTSLAGGDEMDVRGLRPFEAFAHYYGGEMGVQLGDHAEFVGTQLVHSDFFRVFGVAPSAGRLLQPSDAERAAVVSPAFARRNFGTEDAALGRSVSLESTAYEIVGVAPAVLQFPPKTDVWLAAALDPRNRNRSGHNYRAVARLREGETVADANAALSTLAGRLAQAFPDSNGRKGFVAAPLRDTMVSRARSTLYVAMGAVALVLLIACANVANLMLARTAARSREVAVRSALGAGRRRLVRQLLAESLILSAAAGALGVAIAYAGTGALLRAGSTFVPLPRLEDVHVDWRVLLFTAAVSIVTAVGFGLVPALQASRADVTAILNQGAGKGPLGAASSRLRGSLVVAQVALSLTLAIGAGLLLRSFAALTSAPLGFRPEGVLVAYTHVPADDSPSDGKGVDAYVRAGATLDELYARLRQLPGVVSVAGAMGLPTGQYSSDGSYAVEGRHSFSGDTRRLPSAGFRLASPGYFATMGIPLLRGREFEETDLYDRPFVAVVSESLARQTFGAEDPIGHRVQCGFDQLDKWMTIVGVVGDVRQASPASEPGPELYMPLRQHPVAANEVQVVVRTSVPPDSLVETVRRTARALDPDIATKFTTLPASVEDSIAAPRFRTTVVSAFAAVALLLAVAGMYAVMSYLTAQRTSEFGLRVALGAEARDVVGLVLRDALRLAGLGVGIGLVLAIAAGQLARGLLFGVTALDVPTYATVLVAAVPLVVLGAALPALRAARVQPMLALREQ